MNKPYFKEDIRRVLRSIYNAFRPQRNPRTQADAETQRGFSDALARVAEATGVDLESFLLPEDIQRIQKERDGR